MDGGEVQRVEESVVSGADFQLRPHAQTEVFWGSGRVNSFSGTL